MNRRRFMAVVGATVAARPFRASAKQQYLQVYTVRQDWLGRRKEPVRSPVTATRNRFCFANVPARRTII
jgi:hypothetical protein